jgi:hypothetical protein
MMPKRSGVDWVLVLLASTTVMFVLRSMFR